ncbi:MAG: GNAT family N-acetyltransferase [Anaerolineales bacterium]|nr:GNAT family N-acetyltransferase [Anaerolineales bacterium]
MPQSIKAPAACKPHELESFKAMLLLSGQEGEAGLDERIAQAELLAFHYENKKLVAIAGLKPANLGYLKGIFKKAGILEQGPGYSLELGWAHVLGEYRQKGLGPVLMKKLLERCPDRAVFSIVRLSDEEMALGLRKQGFVASGEPYSRRGHRYKYQAYLRELPVKPDAAVS